MANAAIKLPRKKIADFCRRWRIIEMALFGSALREAFSPDGDLDMLVTFDHEADWSLLDHVRMEQELAALLGRKVDLLTKRSVERSHNPIRRRGGCDVLEDRDARGSVPAFSTRARTRSAGDGHTPGRAPHLNLGDPTD